MKRFVQIVCPAILLLFSSSVLAAPTGYSVNADEPAGDRLFAIDLSTGAAVERGLVQAPSGTRTDVEGLAFDTFGNLWGLDDESQKLFPISRTNGLVETDKEANVTGLSAISGNDFGMTFSCDGDLFISSVADQSLYRLALDGTATLIGSMGQSISALATFGKPAQLFGLSNGTKGEEGELDTRSLYSIDIENGTATLIGPIGPAAGNYAEAGLSFDETGQLWAITDRRTIDGALGSEILLLDTSTGTATLSATTSSTGFESLAVAAPSACNDVPPTLPPFNEDYVGIPTLDFYGRLAAVLVLLLAGFFALQRRF